MKKFSSWRNKWEVYGWTFNNKNNENENDYDNDDDDINDNDDNDNNNGHNEDNSLDHKRGKAVCKI